MFYYHYICIPLYSKLRTTTLIWTAHRKSRININLTSHSIQFKKRPTHCVEYSQQIQHARNRRHSRTVHFLFCCSIAFIKLRRKNLHRQASATTEAQMLNHKQRGRRCATRGSKTKMTTMSRRMEGGGLLRFVKCTAAVLLSVVGFAIIDAAIAHIPATPHVKIWALREIVFTSAGDTCRTCPSAAPPPTSPANRINVFTTLPQICVP
jgi:hypothetical protein